MRWGFKSIAIATVMRGWIYFWMQWVPQIHVLNIVIHGQATRDDEFERMKQLGVTISFFSSHIHFWGDRHYDTFLGPERAERISPAASAVCYGVRYTIQNDASATPTRPIHLAHCTVNRITASGRLLGAAQKVSVLSTLQVQTIDVAWQIFQENKRGSIEAGKLADFAVLSRDPLTEPNQLADTVILRPVRRGKTAYQSKDICT